MMNFSYENLKIFVTLKKGLTMKVSSTSFEPLATFLMAVVVVMVVSLVKVESPGTRTVIDGLLNDVLLGARL